MPGWLAVSLSAPALLYTEVSWGQGPRHSPWDMGTDRGDRGAAGPVLDEEWGIMISI